MGSEKISQRSQNLGADFQHEKKTKPRKSKTKDLNMSVYWLLAFLRIILTLVPQTGYIHPDEYFQTVEVVAGDVFDLEVERPWEFNVTFPIRSILVPKLIFGIPYILLAAFTPDLSDIFGWDIRTPYIMLILPRLVSCCLSFVTDYCLYRICILYGQKYRTRLLILATSYVPIIFGTRTLTNSFEMVLMSLLLLLVADCMIKSDKVIYQEEFLERKYASAHTPVERTKLYKMRAVLPAHSLRRCFPIASIAVAGVFNRPTFLAFGLAPVFFWLQRGISSKYCGIRAFHLRIVIFILSAVPALLTFIVIDSFYYGHLTWNEIGMGDVSLNNFVVTPFNFLLYNSRESNLAHHGLHPRVTHMLVNIPLLYNVLGFTGILAVSNFLFRASQARWKELPRAQSLMMLMTTSLIIPVILLSLVPHQEARFLIPITLPLVFLHAEEIQDFDQRPSILYGTRESIQDKKKSELNYPSSTAKQKTKRSLINLWLVINCLLGIFFGFVHQGGVYPLTAHLKEIMRKQTKPQVMHLVTSYMYPIPQSLLVQRNTKHKYFDSKTKTKYLVTRKFYAHELGSQSLPEIINAIEDIIEGAEKNKTKESPEYCTYLAIPSSVVDNKVEFQFQGRISNLTFQRIKLFYPHMSTEAPLLPKTISYSFSSAKPLNLYNRSDFNELSVNSDDSSEGTILGQIFIFLQQFSLSLYVVKSKSY
ncbi:GPI mannosyltransferase 4 [Frankliniella fusca]|uniref:Mannosyltransferase n=1 Tax=Frankliniella fusca TaxID=407009 RepID=A0AAE1HSG0_9NEOP|nr:GPI mannosyltransferase 4 [Frankliniella fusca]